MKVEISPEDARYLAFVMKVHISAAKDRHKEIRAWCEDAGSLNGDFGDDILETDLAVINAQGDAINANIAVLQRLEKAVDRAAGGAA